MISAYCEMYGNTLRNQVMEYLICHKSIGIAVGDMAKELNISRPKAYEIIEEYLKKRYVNKSRIIGRTQLYALNKENTIVKIFRRNFNECIKMIIEEHKTKHESHTATNPSLGTANARTYRY